MVRPVGETESSRDPELEAERRAILAAQAGDRAALGKLLLAYGPTLYRTVLLPRLGSEATAKDALSETYARAVERIGQFRWQGVGIYPWLRTVALRTALDMIRSRARVLLWAEEDLEREIDVQTGSAPADIHMMSIQDQRAARDRVQAVLQRIHPRYARAIQLRIFEEQPREDAARALGVTPATFDVLLHRAIQAIHRSLASSKEEEP
jgi:RNA polymerase sigma-70 factor (ECF subfamily)